MTEHLPALTNPRLRLHQEYAMRTGGYDVDAVVQTDRGMEPFAEVVARSATLDDAIRAVVRCYWLAESDWRDESICADCREVAHA